MWRLGCHGQEVCRYFMRSLISTFPHPSLCHALFDFILCFIDLSVPYDVMPFVNCGGGGDVRF